MFDTARWLLSKDKKFIDSVNMALKLVAWAVPICVTALKLKHLNINAANLVLALESTSIGAWISGFSLVVYYSSWILGAYFDLGMQKDVYRVPRGRKLTWRDAGTMLLVAIAFSLLGFVLDRPAAFFALLAIFWAINIFAWRYLVAKVIVPIADDSAQRFRQRGLHIKLAKLAAVRKYMEGHWQWWRFGVGGILIAALLCHALLDHHAASASSLLVAMALFLAFVIIVEAWTWFKRLATLLLLTEIDELAADYQLTPKAKTDNHEFASARDRDESRRDAGRIDGGASGTTTPDAAPLLQHASPPSNTLEPAGTGAARLAHERSEPT